MASPIAEFDTGCVSFRLALLSKEAWTLLPIGMDATKKGNVPTDIPFFRTCFPHTGNP